MYDTEKPYKNEIIKLIKNTWETPYVSVINGFVLKKFKYPEYHHTDGIGTKGVYHWRQRSFENAVIDSLAMNLNDLAMIKAVPYALIDHLLIPEDDTKAILDIIKHLSSECKTRGIAITGGETAVHDNMEGMELSTSILGFTREFNENKFKQDDALIALKSNGLHSNGFSLIRELYKDEFKEEFIKPTRIYLNEILKLNEKIEIHGMTHVTGGAFTKIKDFLPTYYDAIINNPISPGKIFHEVYDKGVPDEVMYKTFNCSNGFIIGINSDDVKKCLKNTKEFNSQEIGYVKWGKNKVVIKSGFSDKLITY